jgi:hypothetical protein
MSPVARDLLSDIQRALLSDEFVSDKTYLFTYRISDGTNVVHVTATPMDFSTLTPAPMYSLARTFKVTVVED